MSHRVGDLYRLMHATMLFKSYDINDQLTADITKQRKQSKYFY